jgi:hypothetical protein
MKKLLSEEQGGQPLSLAEPRSVGVVLDPDAAPSPDHPEVAEMLANLGKLSSREQAPLSSALARGQRDAGHQALDKLLEEQRLRRVPNRARGDCMLESVAQVGASAGHEVIWVLLAVKKGALGQGLVLLSRVSLV